MAKTGGPGRGVKQGFRKGAAQTGKAAVLPVGRPPRLAHLVVGTDRQHKRERALQAAAIAATSSRHPMPALEGPPPRPGVAKNNVLCLPSPEWLAHRLTVAGPPGELAAFRRSAAGPGTIPWVMDYHRLAEDWVHAMLSPPPSERGISVDGARILAGQLRASVECQDQRAGDCPLDLHALLPVPPRILRLGPDDPAAIAWLWENWTTTWALRGVAEDAVDRAALPDGQGGVCYRFWSADWTPWQAIAALRRRWPALCLQVSVLAVSE